MKKAGRFKCLYLAKLKKNIKLQLLEITFTKLQRDCGKFSHFEVPFHEKPKWGGGEFICWPSDIMSPLYNLFKYRMRVD